MSRIKFLSMYVFAVIFPIFSFIWNIPSVFAEKTPLEVRIEKISAALSSEKTSEYQYYVKYFEKIYETMQDNYYFPVPRVSFEKFLRRFDIKIYPELKKAGKPNNYIKWRSAAYLVAAMKTSEDIFSTLYPPKPAKEYHQTALGKRIDLGIDGELTKEGFLVTKIEPRADPYQKGMRSHDIILQIDNVSVKKLKAEEIKEKLTPLEGAKVKLVFLDKRANKKMTIEVISQEYFKQTVFLLPLAVPHVYCLQMERFNQKTSEDMLNYLVYIMNQDKDSSLVLDLRGNPGGPPLAAREISSFFLPGGEEFAYFQKRGHPKSALDIPKIPEKYHYDGEMVILVDEKSGSSSELFSGILQRRKRAVIMGRNTAGQVFLKSMFDLEDKSMLLLVTGQGFHPDGTAFSFDGVEPDERVPSEQDDQLINFAAQYLYKKRQDAKK